ncbi:protein regulator of cytokinesis 1-like [Drosophila tropicalis]|uniref:protein regulator of cytokinesis 1-like n=1 Tax=Drosophila tropicalis TaxID=46794 RepID=UPI0035ABAFF0
MDHTVKLEILEETSAYVDRLQSMWIHMFEPKTCDEFLVRLKEHVHIFFADVINESTQKEQIILNEIASLKTEAEDLNRLLNEEVVIGERPEDMPLVMWQLQLDKSIEHLRKDLNERRAEIFELLLQQEQLCEELGELPLPLLADPLPKEDELFTFREHLEKMRDKREQRLNEMYELRQEIKQYMKTLELVPTNENIERLLNPINQNLTPETYASLQKLRETYKAQIKEMETGINDMFDKIQKLWDRLGDEVIDPKERTRIEECKSKYNQHTFDILHEELQRCQTLRSQNLQRFIENLRVEIYKWWDLTLKSEQERKRFYNFFNDFYNEDLLELHELELDDLKSYYYKNKTIFELFESRGTLWARMEALEAKANEPGRFNNRGGQLLKEERERKAITSKLPKIEQEITELVQEYQERENAPFLVFGKNILERIAEDWETKKKNRPVYAGKMLPPPTPTQAPRTPMSMRNVSSSTFSLRKTPSQAKLITGSTGNLNKRRLLLTSGSSTNSVNETATPNAKRNLISFLKSPVPSPRNRRPPAQRQLSAKTSTKSPLRRVRVFENTMRRSGGLGRRSMGKNRNAAAANKVAIEVQAPTDDEYEYLPDENCNLGAAPAAPAADPNDTYQDFEPSARSSIMPLGLRQTRTVIKPKSTPSKPMAKKIMTQQLETDDEKRRQRNLPEPRSSRMWRPNKV